MKTAFTASILTNLESANPLTSVAVSTKRNIAHYYRCMMERDIRKEITDQVFYAINREMAEIDKRIKQHEKWCLENNADSRDGIHLHMCEKMALSRLYPTLRTIRGGI